MGVFALPYSLGWYRRSRNLGDAFPFGPSSGHQANKVPRGFARRLLTRVTMPSQLVPQTGTGTALDALAPLARAALGGPLLVTQCTPARRHCGAQGGGLTVPRPKRGSNGRGTHMTPLAGMPRPPSTGRYKTCRQPNTPSAGGRPATPLEGPSTPLKAQRWLARPPGLQGASPPAPR